MMKQKLHFVFIVVMLFNAHVLFSQTTEDFESETTAATTFTNNGQGFIITNGTGETTYDIEFFASGGWNGTGVDNRFIDNSSGNPNTGDGSSFSITTIGGTDITVKSFYLFVSNRTISGSGGPTTITIEGKKDGTPVFNISKSSGIVDGSTFTPNNGFTFIDLATEGGIDNSNVNIDEIIISSTGNADYLALDAFTWDVQTLSNEVFESENQVKVFTTSDAIEVIFKDSIQLKKYTLYNISGIKVNAGSKIKIPTTNLSPGIYILELDFNNETVVKKVAIK